MDRVTAVAQGKKVNACYITPAYYRIYREMFQISTEEPMKQQSPDDFKTYEIFRIR